MALDQNERQLAEAYYRKEFRSVFAWKLLLGSVGFLLIHIFAYFFPNEYQLMFNCHLLFLPPDAFLFAWELNYLAMAFMSYFVIVFFISYVHLPLLLMNQTCWLLDLALLTAEQMNKDLPPDREVSDEDRIRMTDEHAEKFIGRCLKVVEWRNQVQGLLYWNFNLEFQIQAIILCLCIYFLSLDFFASLIVPAIFLVCLAQLFIYCLMGTRITDRFAQQSYEISKNWHLMTPKQRKVAQMILHWTQNMNGFTGTFKDVSLETFQSVRKFEFETFFYILFNYVLRFWKHRIRFTLSFDHPGLKLAKFQFSFCA